ncbi:urease accessory protein UreF [Tropicimonas sp. IMCC6043]|uniref:urease accessory protein UreF n=1 Tax=Tropicimonas sp. IMCC6043 TaxID=2510645 RepID=UPI00101BA965|nr:urease accessory UreF family protein [Tropicimonas sp. IMCC6043]RYH10618.1 urease accessory protein UreF [Tropicimonas sp. IMCC6043]
MSTEAILTLTQWLSPAFPVGGFAYSHGLEAAIAAGEVSDAASLERWLRAVLEQGAGRCDAILLCHAMRGVPEATELAALAESLAASRERWLEAREQGAAFMRAVNALTGAERDAYPLPVAVGAAAAGLELGAAEVAAFYLQAFAANLVSAGVRFVPLGQTEGQAVLARLRPRIVALAGAAAEAGLDEIGSAAFGADIAAMRHETMDVRLFKS